MRELMVVMLLLGAGPVWGERARVAVLPLAGDAEAALKERVSFSLRSKIDREGTYEAVAGVEVVEAWGEVPPPTVQSEPTFFVNHLKSLSASVFIYGRLDGTIRDGTLVVAVWDARSGGSPKVIEQRLSAPTDLRFASEGILEALSEVGAFEHPREEAVRQDAASDARWRDNPDLVVNGGFDNPSDWEGIYQSERYVVPLHDTPPAPDQVAIWRMEDGEKVLAMHLSRTAAENHGLACLSGAIPIEPQRRYRLQFRYRSDGPKLHVFVKGYTRAKNARGRWVMREVYRRQVPSSGATDGRWVVVTDDLNPQHPVFAVTELRIDLYAYLHPGRVLFDEVVLKAVGEPAHPASDEALDAPVTRPTVHP